VSLIGDPNGKTVLLLQILGQTPDSIAESAIPLSFRSAFKNTFQLDLVRSLKISHASRCQLVSRVWLPLDLLLETSSD
jgi:hypothetical protein